MAKVIRNFGSYAHGQLHYRIARPETPTARPLMCLHLSPSSGRIYSKLLGEMGNDRICIAPDTPGFGESDVPPEPLSIADFAQANFDLLDQLGISEPVDVVGYHTGSMTAPEMARQHPDRINRLVLISAPIFTDDEREGLKTAYHNSAAIDEDGGHLTELWKQYCIWSDKTLPKETLMTYFAEHLRNIKESSWGLKAAFSYHLENTLPEIDQPILVLNPDDDVTEFTPRAVPLMKNGQLKELPGWGIGFPDAHTAEFSELLRQFLD